MMMTTTTIDENKRDYTVNKKHDVEMVTLCIEGQCGSLGSYHDYSALETPYSAWQMNLVLL